ncbi:hypothetical protein TNCV_1199571 [Trichonephila clavipes]|uniref:Uncharacterized protein n=1 Tax=Trichonephila clavipes TaxID=2585209 RepID=A0A8X6VE75_TRICX|nr:hypothetical protein TNCV_1199571 [Trichonephila clavipes]
MFSVLQYAVFPAEGSQRDTPDRTPGVSASLCKTVVEFLPGNSSSTHRSKVTSKLRCRCTPLSPCIQFLSSNLLQISMLCGDLPDDNSTCLEFIP